MRKLVAILLVLMLAVSMTACQPETTQIFVQTQSLRTIGEAVIRTEYQYYEDGTMSEMSVYFNDELYQKNSVRVTNGIQYVTATDSAGNSSTQAIESLYNEAGQLIQMTTVYSGMNTVKTQYTYDAEGKVTKVVSNSLEGKLVTTNTYDEQGNLVSQLQINEDTGTYLRVDSVYNDDAFVIKESTYSAEDVLESYVEISYANENTEKTVTHYDAEGKATGEVVVMTFDEHGNTVKEVTTIDGELAMTIVNTYITMEVPVK